MQLFVITTCVLLIGCVQADYWMERNDFIRGEESMAIGSQQVLSKKEQLVNKYLMEFKHKELKRGFINPETFAPARHFFHAREDIMKSPVFKLIQKMPKGGALHVHDTAISSTDYVLHNITYRDNLYACIGERNIKSLKFSECLPEGKCWRSVKELRMKNVTAFDAWLRRRLTLVTEDPEKAYPDINTVWNAFSSIFALVTPMLTYKPVFSDYFYNALMEFKADNINYVEVRGTLPSLHELNGTTYGPVETLGILKEVADKFLADHPDFLGIKYIYAPSRRVDNSTMDNYVTTVRELRRIYPDFLVGFDLVGQEDLGRPLESYISQLLDLSDDTRFYFHAGETNWNGLSTDLNLVDAVMLNTTRIGHGYALVKHPKVMKEVKRRNIGIEINPISNQVLNLVKDMRNHPASILFAEDYPVVISSDDPGLWSASGLSFDFYEAFMGIASSTADLRMLKQLALNSFMYSSLSNEEKAEVLIKWVDKWNTFIDVMIVNNNYAENE